MPSLRNTIFEKPLSEIVKPSWSNLINIPHDPTLLECKLSSKRKHDDLAETFSILERMHQYLDIELKAIDAYDVQQIEQLLERCDCVGTAAIIARTSLEQVVADFMANQDEQELELFLNELAGEAHAKGLDPVNYVAHYAEGELGAARGYARRLRYLVGREVLRPNEESRRILNYQLSEVIEDWNIFVNRARYKVSQLVFE